MVSESSKNLFLPVYLFCEKRKMRRGWGFKRKIKCMKDTEANEKVKIKCMLKFQFLILYFFIIFNLIYLNKINLIIYLLNLV